MFTELFNYSYIHVVLSTSKCLRGFYVGIYVYQVHLLSYIFSCRRGRFWWRRKCRVKYRGPWWRWPAVSITVAYAQVHDWVSVDSDDTQRSDATLCHAIHHGHVVGVDKLCYSSDSTLYNKMPVGKLVKSRTNHWFCHYTSTCANCF